LFVRRNVFLTLQCVENSGNLAPQNGTFKLAAPTTSSNALRILRAMQLSKPGKYINAFSTLAYAPCFYEIHRYNFQSTVFTCIETDRLELLLLVTVDCSAAGGQPGRGKDKSSLSAGSQFVPSASSH
jgi:hypothetical protein